jgi:hypothetical protein
MECVTLGKEGQMSLPPTGPLPLRSLQSPVFAVRTCEALATGPATLTSSPGCKGEMSGLLTGYHLPQSTPAKCVGHPSFYGHGYWIRAGSGAYKAPGGAQVPCYLEPEVQVS